MEQVLCCKSLITLCHKACWGASLQKSVYMSSIWWEDCHVELCSALKVGNKFWNQYKVKRNLEYFRACQNPSCSILNKLKVMEWSLQSSSVKGIAHIKTEGKKCLCVSPLQICFWELMVILKNITRMIRLKMRFNWRCHWTVSDCFYYFLVLLLSFAAVPRDWLNTRLKSLRCYQKRSVIG